MSRLSFFSQPQRTVPLLVFAILLIHGSLLGLTDDEAYYWVLAQKPALAYAYHPPAVAWLIAISQKFFGGILGAQSAAMVRLPAALCAALVVRLGLDWMKSAGVPERNLWKGAAAILSFAGFFSLAWMMVPDLPLFLGWTLAFVSCWRICQGDESRRHVWLLSLGMALSVLSKYSGVLVGGSAFLSLLFWAPRRIKGRVIAALILGGFLGVLPSLLWNAAHHWDSLLYQVRDRHEGGSLSLARYLKFWGAELLAAGPVLVGFVFFIFAKSIGKSVAAPERRRSEQRGLAVYRFASLWILPAFLIFCFQPLWADFKPHWAFIVWWPSALVLGWYWGDSTGRSDREIFWGGNFQAVYGFVLGVAVLGSCHFPLMGWITGGGDPRQDVTNDLYGWSELEGFIRERLGEKGLEIPILGSRYQTASQAAFALKSATMRATLLPRDSKSREEWPDFPVAESWGPHWPKLTSQVLFVADNRYGAGPQYPGARCESLGRLEKHRGRFVAKWIEVWKCEPELK